MNFKKILHILLVALLIFPINSCSNKEEDVLINQKIKPNQGPISTPIEIIGIVGLTVINIVAGAVLEIYRPSSVYNIQTDQSFRSHTYTYTNNTRILPRTPIIRVDQDETRASHRRGENRTYFVVDREASDTGTYWFNLEADLIDLGAGDDAANENFFVRNLSINLSNELSSVNVGQGIVRSSYFINTFEDDQVVAARMRAYDFNSNNTDTRIRYYISNDVDNQFPANANLFDIDSNHNLMDVEFEEHPSRRLNGYFTPDITISKTMSYNSTSKKYTTRLSSVSLIKFRFNELVPTFVRYEYENGRGKKLYKIVYNSYRLLENQRFIIEHKFPAKTFVTNTSGNPSASYKMVSYTTGVLDNKANAKYDGIVNAPVRL